MYFSPVVSELLMNQRLPELGPGRPELAVKPALARLTPALVVEPYGVADSGAAAACISGLWLHFDFLEESHEISQSLKTTEGSYWHGLMHRREPDASNAGYWFRRVGSHPVFERLTAEAKGLGLRLESEGWSPFEFIELCEKHRGTGGDEEMLLRRVQQLEWEMLFNWCFRRAMGGKGSYD